MTFDIHNDAGALTTLINRDSLARRSADLAGTTKPVRWSDDYLAKLIIAPDAPPTQEQIEIHRRRREYTVPIFNRGQKAVFRYLTSAKEPNTTPSLWVDVVHKGVRVKFATPEAHLFGVPQKLAALIGPVLGVCLWAGNVYVAAGVFLIYGVAVVVPGAAVIKLWRRFASWL